MNPIFQNKHFFVVLCGFIGITMIIAWAFMNMNPPASPPRSDNKTELEQLIDMHNWLGENEDALIMQVKIDGEWRILIRKDAPL